MMTKTGSALIALCLTLAPASSDAATVTASIFLDPDRPAGTGSGGRVLLFAPSPVSLGSSVSHFDRSASPDLLLEPSISASLSFGDVDLTIDQLLDIGWQAGNSNINVNITDPPGAGFNDPGLGQQRVAAIRFAADLWDGLLASPVRINLDVKFSALSCGNNSATLAQAFSPFVFRDFAGAPLPNLWYHGALAESLSGSNLSLQNSGNPNIGDLSVTFNSAIDTGCLGSGNVYYYGLDGNVPTGRISFIAVALHELAHSLGFSSFTNLTTGAFFQGTPGIYDRFILDTTLSKRWHRMSNAERIQSATNSGELVWAGPRVTQRAPQVLPAGPVLRISSPANATGSYQVGTAAFGPPLSTTRLNATVALTDQGGSSPTLACNPLTNPGQIQGKIALVDRGSCNFTVKVKNAQDAGAIGVIVADHRPGPVVGMGGNDPTIIIPSVRISLADGNRLKAALAENGGGGNGGSCLLTNGSGRFCTDCGPCGAGEGDCDSDNECQTGLTCANNVGADFGFSPGIDVCIATGGGGGSCTLPDGSGRFCTDCGPCGSGQGDCDNDGECQAGLTCTNNVGADFGFRPGIDVCLPADGGTCPLNPGSGRFCTECGPCGSGQGDCDNDGECQAGLTCTNNTGADFGFGPNIDVCQ